MQLLLKLTLTPERIGTQLKDMTFFVCPKIERCKKLESPRGTNISPYFVSASARISQNAVYHGAAARHKNFLM